MSLYHRRPKNAHDLRESLHAAPRSRTRAVGDKDDTGAVSSSRVESVSRCGIGDDARLVAFAAVAGLEVLCCLGGFSCVGDDAADGVLVVEEAVDDVHALACIGTDD